jgi:hypothetical protein
VRAVSQPRVSSDDSAGVLRAQGLFFLSWSVPDDEANDENSPSLATLTPHGISRQIVRGAAAL